MSAVANLEACSHDDPPPDILMSRQVYVAVLTLMAEKDCCDDCLSKLEAHPLCPPGYERVT